MNEEVWEMVWCPLYAAGFLPAITPNLWAELTSPIRRKTIEQMLEEMQSWQLSDVELEELLE